MSDTAKWVRIDAEPGNTKLKGPISKDLGAFLEGAAVSRAGVDATTNGAVVRSDSGWAINWPHGTVEALTYETAAGYEFKVPTAKLNNTAAGTDAATGEIDRLSIVAACPPWARRVVAKHLLPEELAAFDKSERDARVASLKRSAAVAQGKAVSAETKTTSPQQAARVEQLRQIGRAVSAGRKL